jgi:hypothetical protein
LIIGLVETYIVRLWKDDETATDTVDGQGIVRHVGSGQELPFRTFAQLLAFLRERPRPAGGDRELPDWVSD